MEKGGKFELISAFTVGKSRFLRQNAIWRETHKKRELMIKYCYFNGKFIRENRVGISPRDLGVLRGYAVFDFMRTEQGKLLFFSRHFSRFKNSARELGLRIPAGRRELERIIKRLINKNHLREAYIKFILTGGVSGDGISLKRQKSTFLVLADRQKLLPQRYYVHGVKIITSEFRRELPAVKSSNYIWAIKEQEKREAKGAIETLYIFQGQVFEASRSNFFIFRGNKLITAGDGILLGITRGFVLELARNKFEIEERKLKVSELKLADEAFITATTKRIMPVVKIDGFKVGDGKVGEKTKWLTREFGRKIKEL